MSDLLEVLNFGILLYFFSINGFYLFLLGLSLVKIRTQSKLMKTFRLTGQYETDQYKSTSIIVPAYNEEENIISSVQSLLQVQFHDFEVIVINDGSSDQTMKRLKEHFELFELDRVIPKVIEQQPNKAVYGSETFDNLIVIDKQRGSKADALNAGINAARKELVCSVDSDSLLEPDVLNKLSIAFSADENTIAVGGIVRLANGCEIENGRIKQISTPRTFLEVIQAVEYLRAYLFGRVGFDTLNGLFIMSGAFSIFTRESLINVGGYDKETVGEDVEMVQRLHRWYRENDIPYNIKFMSHPVCWTEAPTDWDTLQEQRQRWQQGLAYSMFKHKSMIFNPKHNLLGMVVLPFFLIFELFGPIIEIGSYLLFAVQLFLGIVYFEFAVLFLIATVLLGIILSISSVLAEEYTLRKYPRIGDVFILLGGAIVENLGYRQIHSWWRLQGLLSYFRGTMEWGVMQRKGHDRIYKGHKNEFASQREGIHKAWDFIVHWRYWIAIGLINVFLIAIIMAI
ncbi:glycosyltransferase family 2 protein [Fodinibius sp. AD559]|uniref:glycosyltransferase family 2 protein n=1 Tax=Fodinibius sp. AD559 TaxID=3424179 RepID=UPI0040469ECC